MSKRLFVAIDLPDSTRQLLAGLDPDIRGVRWTELGQMHLTLSFFGDVPEDIELKLREKLSAIGFGAFFLPVNGVGVFSSKGAPKIIWIGVGKAHPHLFQIHKRVQEAALAVGIEPELRPWHPHILTSECRVRCWDDPCRGVPSVFQQSDACGTNSYSRTHRSL
jgi:2'-5' RNA ligase